MLYLLYNLLIYTLFNDVFNSSDTLMQEHRLKSFQNRVLRKIFRPKREKVTEGWRRLLNEELHELYCSPNIIWVIRSGSFNLAEHVARTGEMGIQDFGWET